MTLFSRWRSRVTSAVALSLSAGLAVGGLAIAPAQADDEHGLGALPSSQTILPVQQKLEPTAPTSVDLSGWSVEVGNQGQVGSCTAWAIGYAMMGLYANKAGGPVNSFAPMYMYSQINGGRDAGSNPVAALALASSQGMDTQIHYSRSDYDWLNQPNAAEKAAASQFKLTGYKTLFAGVAAGVNGQTAIQNSIAAGHPVAIMFPVRKGFDNLSSTNTVDTDTTNPSRGLHEVLAVGYNATGLRIQNSWGTGWGSKGYGYLAWNVVQKDVTQADVATGYTVNPKPTAGSIRDLNGDNLADIIARTPDGSLNRYLNTGNRTHPYSSATRIGTGWQMYSTVLSADVNGDGKADILGIKPDGTLMLYVNTGNSAVPYNSATQIGSGWQMYSKAIAADVNGDGKADILGIKPDGTLMLYLNTGGSIPYNSATKIGSGWQMYSTVMAADINNDRKADIMGIKPDGTLMLYRNSSNVAPYYSAGVKIGSGWQMYSRAFAEDVTGDGKAEIMAIKPNGTLWLYRNSGANVPFVAGTQIGSGWQMYNYIG